MKNIYFSNNWLFKKITEYLLFKNKDFGNLALKDDLPINKIDTVKVKHSSTRYAGAGNVPDFLGLDKRSSSTLGDKVGAKIIHRGIGVVVEQSPEKGTPLKSGETIILEYRPPSYD